MAGNMYQTCPLTCTCGALPRSSTTSAALAAKLSVAALAIPSAAWGPQAASALAEGLSHHMQQSSQSLSAAPQRQVFAAILEAMQVSQ